MDRLQHDSVVSLILGVPVTVDTFATTDGAAPSVYTRAELCWQADALHIRFDCEDPEIVAQRRRKNDAQAWLDDCVEVYLDIAHTHDDSSSWLHILVTAAAAVCLERNRDIDGLAFPFAATVSTHTDGWSAQFALPWAALGVSPGPGDLWGFNLNRAEYPAGEYICLSPTGSAFANIHRWGHLHFDGPGSASATALMAPAHARVADAVAADMRRRQIQERPFAAPPTGVKTQSVFYPAARREAARAAAAPGGRHPHLGRAAAAAVEPWMALSYDALWALVVGPTILRTWTVLTHGHCPSCRGQVVMYNWQIDAFAYPWKVQCPHCDKRYPENDFAAYYRSGLDRHGIFAFDLADRSLLGADPTGVDDGHGCIDGDQRLRFIGAYLVYGQWKEWVVAGIQRLSAAHVLTGRPEYARRAGILLDRVADLYPSFDFRTQGQCYEKHQSDGYVSMWHDACEETRQLVLAYDAVFEAIRDDDELVAFLHAQATQHELENAKACFADIQRNIESGLLIDPLLNYHKIHSNYPRAATLQSEIMTVLGWPEARDDVMTHAAHIIELTTGYDGVTGEKGLAGYSAFVIQSFATYLARLSLIEPGLLDELIARQPALARTYRFFIDTHCLGCHYPQVGDAGWFASRYDRYAGVNVSPISGETPAAVVAAVHQPSMYAFLHRLFTATGHTGYLDVLAAAAGDDIDRLPHDVCCVDGEAVRAAVRSAPGTPLASVNFEDWCLAILRSGDGANERALWISYDNGGSHGHYDGMNIGLFAHRLDLLPDYGYPPLQYSQEQAQWYRDTAAHCTVTIDGRNLLGGHNLSHRSGMRQGRTLLWQQTCPAQVATFDGAEIAECSKFERTVALVDIDDVSFYIVDIFRVTGGREHVWHLHSQFGSVTTDGLDLVARPALEAGTQMRNIRTDRAPSPGWQVDWQLENRYGFSDVPASVGMRVRGLTPGAEAGVAEGWVVAGQYSSLEEAWIPRLLQRRRQEERGLQSTFVSVIEPYLDAPSLNAVSADVADNSVTIRTTIDDNGTVDTLHLSFAGQRPTATFARQP
jgi:hypothetical protein